MIRIKQSIEVGAPIDLCFDVLRQFEGYPRFIEQVHIVYAKEEGTFRWVATTEKGYRQDWDMVAESNPEKKRIVWRTLEDDHPKLSAHLNLQAINPSQTRLEVEIIHNTMADVFRELFFNFKERAEQLVGQSLENYRELTESLAQRQKTPTAPSPKRSQAEQRRQEKPSIVIGPGNKPTEL